MKNLLWQTDGYGWTTDDAGTVYPLASKPVLSFAYDALYHEANNEFFVLNGVRTALSAAQVSEIEGFIATVPQTHAALVMGVDAKGKYLGWVSKTDPNFYRQVNSDPWSNDFMRYDFNTNQWLRVQAVDSNGNYLGNIAVDDPKFYADVQSAPPFSYSVWDFAAKNWKDGRTLAQLQVDLCGQIDTLADQICLRYVTGGQTQGARYQRKLVDALAYKAAGYPNSDTPASIDHEAYPYIYWEANQTGQYGKPVADTVIQQASDWDGKGGQIEGYRIGGKKNINAATDAAEAANACATAITNLESC